MELYLVGGAVRDELLGLPVRDRDWVVVGATAEQLIAQGYHQVGKDFPVFLHPETQEEYALARTERKTSKGYRGFSVNTDSAVTLEQDLARRDLTINSIAKDKHGQIIDPYHGQDDLKRGILRHISPAFCEDPVRILRVARFAARFGFTIADETMALMRKMVAANEVDYLVAERIWQEVAKGLMEKTPMLMFTALRECGSLARIMPEIDALFCDAKLAAHATRAIALAVYRNASLAERFALLCHDVNSVSDSNQLVSLAKRLKIPKECYDLTNLAARFQQALFDLEQLDDLSVLQLLKSCDALRRQPRFLQLLSVCKDYKNSLQNKRQNLELSKSWCILLDAVLKVDALAISKIAANKSDIPQLIEVARISAIHRIRQNLSVS